MTSCPAPLATERLLDYLLGELEPGDEEGLEAHLFECGACGAEAETLAGLAARIRDAVPWVLPLRRFEVLEAAGRVVRVNVMSPGEKAQVFYPPPGRLLVHRLAGADPGAARRLDLTLRTPEGAAIGHLEDVPFDPATGAVLIACQNHFSEQFPRDLVFVLEAVEGEERRDVAAYTVEHRTAGS